MWTDSARAKYARAARRCATDLTDAEVVLVAPRPPAPSRLGRPRTIDLRAVLDAIFYLGLAPLLIRIRRRFPWLHLLLADGGHQGEVAAAAARHKRVVLAIVKRSARAAGFVALPRRWVVERTFAWLGRHRRMAKDVETLIATSIAHLYLAAIRMLTRRLATP